MNVAHLACGLILDDCALGSTMDIKQVLQPKLRYRSVLILQACVQYNANEYAFRVRIACCCILFLGTTAHDDGQEHIKIVNPGPLLERDAVKKSERD